MNIKKRNELKKKKNDFSICQDELILKIQDLKKKILSVDKDMGEIDKKMTKLKAKKDVDGDKNFKELKTKKTNTKRKITILNKELDKLKKDRKEVPILKLENIKRSYGEVQALKGISFEIKSGERVGLIGGNGAGKTTVSEIIMGLNKGDEGKITYGFEYKNVPQESMGMQFQDSNYPSGLTVKDIIMFARNVHHLDMTTEQLKKLLDIFQMGEFYNKNSRSLSGGQRQKLNILLSVLHKPKIVIMDELSTGLDISAREEIIKFTDELLSANNMSAIVISHHTEEITKICDRVIVFDRGTIVAQGLIKDIEKEYGSLDNFMRKHIEFGNQNNKTSSDFKIDKSNKKKKEKKRKLKLLGGGK
ncbi:ABC transporter ATP-binding protein [Mycoplasma marinum]|uniref:ABC transporter ATP-binding protein n=1 Tax=Mycoplasma marinum TaxID=1937190 RepID=UPI003B346F8E